MVRRARHRSTHRSRAAAPTSRACSPTSIRHAERPILRTAPAPLYLLSGLVRDAGLQGGADRRRRRRGLRRLRHLQGSQASAASARASPSRIAAAAVPAALSVSAGAAERSRPSYLAAFFGAGARRARRPAVLAPAALAQHRGGKLFFSDDLRAALGGYDAAEELRRAPARRVSRAGIRCTRRSISKRAFLLPGYILSSQGDRMAMAHASRAAFPSSITAWSSSPRAFPPR